MRDPHKNSELEIDGWGLEQHVTLMRQCSQAQHRSGVQGGVVEIGTYLGSTFIPLLRCKHASERALAVDPFDNAAPEGIEYSRGGRAILEGNVRNAMAGENVDIWEISSDAVTVDGLSARLGHESARLFHVDGSRAAASVSHGLHLAESVLLPGGCVFLDDFLNEGWPTVTEGAFARFAGGSNLVPFALIKCKLGLCFGPFRGLYVNAAQCAISGMDLDQSKTVRLFGYQFPMGR